MPTPLVLLAALTTGGFASAVVLLVAGLRGIVVDPTRPGRSKRLLARPRSSVSILRVSGGPALAVALGLITRWPVAAIAFGLLISFWPTVVGGAQAERLAIVRLEAVVLWCESIRDVVAAHASLEQAIPATTANAPATIRPALLRLTGQLASKVPLERSLADLADDLDHSADLVIAALQLNVRTRGDGLVRALTNVAVSGREELDLRRGINAGRAGDRRAVQLMMVIVVAVATFLVLFGDAYVAPYRTFAGQVVLTVVIGLFATSFVWLQRLASPKPATPFLPVAGRTVDPMDARVVAALVPREPDQGRAL